MFSLIGDLLDTVDRSLNRAYVVEVEHGRLSATGYFLSPTSCMRSKTRLCRPRVVTDQSPIFQLPSVLSRRKGDLRRPL